MNAASPVEVTIRTNRGQTLTGRLDARTSERQLWLRQEDEGIVLATPVSWSAIITAKVDGKTVKVSALRKLPTSSGTVGFLAHYVAKDAPARPWVAARVTHIEIDAQLVQLDRDVEPDGVELTIAAIDAHGDGVPVKGSLSARLWTERDGRFEASIRFEELQRWTRPVVPLDFVEGAASYVLPFRTIHPEFDLELWPHALLNVRLGVFGQGSYEATVPVALREFNPMRDRLQYFQGSRFFRDELSQHVRRRAIEPVGTERFSWSR